MVSPLRCVFVGLLALTAACSHALPHVAPNAPSAAQDAGAVCVSAVTPLIPREATSSIFVRPRAMFDHPRIGRALQHAISDDGEQALMRRSQRIGYDVRTVERAVMAWAPRGWVAVGIGSFDGAQIVERMWDRMLPPRRRTAIGPRALRAEGMIAEIPVAVAVEQACGVAAYAEVDTRRCDRAIATSARGGGEDPAAWLVWRAHDVPDAVAEGDALIHRLHDLALTISPHPEGVSLGLTLGGECPPDALDRIRRAITVFDASEFGELIGASDWMSPEVVQMTLESSLIQITLVIPFRGIDALAEAIRGRVGEGLRDL